MDNRLGASVKPPNNQIRATFTENTIRVYQAFSSEISKGAIAAQTFIPPFKRERMTWIKPSFMWMMYRSGWATKPGQERILAIDISRAGFEWALAHACLTHFDPILHKDQEGWEKTKRASSVRIQWDPERDMRLQPLPWRTIQIGLGGIAVNAYLDTWIVAIEDITDLAKSIEEAVSRNDVNRAQLLVPQERPFVINPDVAHLIGCTN